MQISPDARRRNYLSLAQVDSGPPGVVSPVGPFAIGLGCEPRAPARLWRKDSRLVRVTRPLRTPMRRRFAASANATVRNAPSALGRDTESTEGGTVSPYLVA